MTEPQPATVDEDAVPTPVGQRIRDRRLELGLSQAEIAEGMLSPSYVSLVESGRRQPAASALAHIAERLRVDVEYLRDGVDASVRTRARLALGRAEIALQQGKFDDAYTQFRALAGDRGLNDEQIRRTRLGGALARERSGDLEGAIELLSGLADEARRAPSVQSWLDVALALSRCYRDSGDLDMAIQVGEEALRSVDELGLTGSDEHIRLGCTLLTAYHGRGDVVRATQFAAELVEVADHVGAPHTRGAAYWNASLVAESRGDLALALDLVDRALAMFGESDDQRNLARLRLAYAWLLLQGPSPQPQKALDLLEGAYDQIVIHGAAHEVGQFDTTRAEALMKLGRLDEARESAEKSLREVGDQPRVSAALARLALARVMRSQGDLGPSIDEAAKAAATLESVGATRIAASAWRELGDFYRGLDRADDALRAFDRALRAVRLSPKAGINLVIEEAANERGAKAVLGVG